MHDRASETSTMDSHKAEPGDGKRDHPGDGVYRLGSAMFSKKVIDPLSTVATDVTSSLS